MLAEVIEASSLSEAESARLNWQTHETNVTGRLLYDKMARHFGFIVYSHDL